MAALVKVALVGIGGYGDAYLSALFGTPEKADLYELVGLVDPNPHRSARLDEVRARKIPIHDDLESLYAGASPELVMMATPIHLHAPHTLWCLQRGSNVLCEKPLAATVTDARKMVASETLAQGRFVAIGYQWSFSNAIQSLKRDVMAGLLGAPRRLKSIVSFPRGREYFGRNDWAGKIKTDTGEPVFDSPANNAAAHYLHNMFYLLGATTTTSAMPVSVLAELYRANDIQNYDTAAIRCKTDIGAEILFYTTHATSMRLGPIARYEFEDAVVSYEAESGAGLVARFRGGKVRRYGEPNTDRHSKMWQAMLATGKSAGVEPIPCGPRAAMAHVLCVAAAQASMPRIAQFPQSMLQRERLGESDMICVSGLHAALVQCYDQGILPSEHGGLGWSEPGQLVNVSRSDADGASHINPTPGRRADERKTPAHGHTGTLSSYSNGG